MWVSFASFSIFGMSTKFKRSNHCETRVVLCFTKNTLFCSQTLNSETMESQTGCRSVEPTLCWALFRKLARPSLRHHHHHQLTITSTTTSSLQPSSSTHMHIDVLLCICFSANLVQLKRLVLAYFYTALSAQHTSIFCSGSQTYFAYFTF